MKNNILELDKEQTNEEKKKQFMYKINIRCKYGSYTIRRKLKKN